MDGITGLFLHTCPIGFHDMAAYQLKTSYHSILLRYYRISQEQCWECSNTDFITTVTLKRRHKNMNKQYAKFTHPCDSMSHATDKAINAPLIEKFRSCENCASGKAKITNVSKKWNVINFLLILAHSNKNAWVANTPNFSFCDCSHNMCTSIPKKQLKWIILEVINKLELFRWDINHFWCNTVGKGKHWRNCTS